MKKYIYLSIFTIGCYTAKKATKEINKAHERYPEVVAKKTTEWYPCIPYKFITDSSAYKDWLRSFDSLNNLYLGYVSQVPDTIYSEKHDTIIGKCLDKKALIKYRDVIKRIPAIHDTIYKLDSANNFVLHTRINDCESERLKLLKDYLKFKNYLISLLILFCISLSLNIIQFKFRK